MTKKKVLHMLIDSDLKTALAELAKQDCRTTSSLVTKVLRDFVNTTREEGDRKC